MKSRLLLFTFFTAFSLANLPVSNASFGPCVHGLSVPTNAVLHAKLDWLNYNTKPILMISPEKYFGMFLFLAAHNSKQSYVLSDKQDEDFHRLLSCESATPECVNIAQELGNYGYSFRSESAGKQFLADLEAQGFALDQHTKDLLLVAIEAARVYDTSVKMPPTPDEVNANEVRRFLDLTGIWQERGSLSAATLSAYVPDLFELTYALQTQQYGGESISAALKRDGLMRIYTFNTVIEAKNIAKFRELIQVGIDATVEVAERYSQSRKSDNKKESR